MEWTSVSLFMQSKQNLSIHTFW